MAVNITDKQAELMEQAGYTDDDIQATIDGYRTEGLSDEAIQQKINESYPDAEIATLKGNVEKSEWYDPAINLLPTAGAISGAILGEGVASVPAAAGGATAGELARQGILNLAGRQHGIDKEALRNEAVFSGLGQTLGLGGGKVFQAVAPKVGKFAAGITPQAYQRALKAIDEGRSIFGTSVEKAAEGVNKASEGLSKLPPINKGAAKGIVNKTIAEYEGGGINPAAERIGGRLKKIENQLEKATKMKNGEAVIDLKALHKIKKDIQDVSKTQFGSYKSDSNELYKKISRALNERLKKASPEYAKANQKFRDAKAAEEFNKLLKYDSPMGLLKLGAPIGIGAATGQLTNPILWGAEAVQSPMAHKLMLKIYNALKNKLPPTGGGVGAGTASFVNAKKKKD